MKKIKTGLLNIAIERFIKSDYLTETVTILPLTLITILVRAIFNFLITSRIYTSYFILNFIMNLIVTVSLSLCSPIIYIGFHRTYEEELKEFSKIVLDSVWLEGWIFIDQWKNRIFGSLGIMTVIVLFFIEVNSRMIQEAIIHTIISSMIIDYLTNRSVSDTKVKIYSSPTKISSYENIDSNYLRTSVSKADSESSDQESTLNSSITFKLVDDYSINGFDMDQFEKKKKK